MTTRPNVRKAFQASGCLDDSSVQTKRSVQAEIERQDGRGIIIFFKNCYNTLCKKVGQSSLLHNKLLFGHVIFIHTHTHRALLWKHPCKYLPPCLLCCYSSHPRIVFFFFLTHSLVFVTHSLQWKPQLDLSLIPPFFLTFSSLPKEQLAILSHQHVLVCAL